MGLSSTAMSILTSGPSDVWGSVRGAEPQVIVTFNLALPNKQWTSRAADHQLDRDR